MNDFSDFLAGMMPQYDHVLLVGDFNIHVCCPDKPLVKDSFNLVQCVTGPTHEHGHTLDLVLSHGLSVSSLEICENALLDHMPVLFEVVFSSTAINSGALAQRCRTFNSFTATQFAALFNQLCVPSDLTSSGMEELSSWFHSSCQTL